MKTLSTLGFAMGSLELTTAALTFAASDGRSSDNPHTNGRVSFIDGSSSRYYSSDPDYQPLASGITGLTESSRTLYSESTAQTFQKVTSLHARVQGDMPQWDVEKQRFVSDYYTTFDDKYRAVLDTVNMAAVEGALKYVQAECINASVVTDCKRKNNIEYVVFYQTTVVQPKAAMEFYANVTDEHVFTIEHCPFLPMDGGQCHTKVDGASPNACDQYSGVNGQPDLGFCVGGSLQDSEVIAPYPHNYWFSFPNSCPQSRWGDKTDACRSEYAGGLCPLGVEPDGESCTFSYEVLGYILLDDVVGITSLMNPQTNKNFVNYTEFCETGGVEFSVTISGEEVTWLAGLDFWANPGNSDANAARAEKLVTAYSELVATNATTNDGGEMKPLPTASLLRENNPPCYENSKVCATAEYGCRRSYRSQICQVCSANEPNCVKKSRTSYC